MVKEMIINVGNCQCSVQLLPAGSHVRTPSQRYGGATENFGNDFLFSP